MTRALELQWPERLERNVRVVEMFSWGTPTAEIAKRIGLTQRSVYVILWGAGIWPRLTHRDSSGPRPMRGRTQREVAIALAREKGETLARIAQRYKISKQRVSAILKAMPR